MLPDSRSGRRQAPAPKTIAPRKGSRSRGDPRQQRASGRQIVAEQLLEIFAGQSSYLRWRVGLTEQPDAHVTTLSDRGQGVEHFPKVDFSQPGPQV